jgi:membrane protease YdiL (CAAX protease family)
MLQLSDHLYFLILTLFVPPRAVMSMRRLERAADDELPRLRLRSYRMILIFQWGLALLLLVLWQRYGRSWSAIGLVPRLNGGSIGVFAGILIVVGVLVVQSRAQRDDERLWERLRQRMQRLRRLLPKTRAELRWFGAVSFTAGVCEELLYRGFVIWYLGHVMPIVPAAFLSAAIFGLAHLYQGLGGILRTGALGGFLASVYLLTGSLYLPMVLHVLADAYSGHMMYEAYRREAALAPASPPPSGSPWAARMR